MQNNSTNQMIRWNLGISSQDSTAKPAKYNPGFQIAEQFQISSLLSEAFRAPSAVLSSRDIITMMSHKLYIILEMPILKISISKQTSCWKSFRWTHHILNRILTSSGVQIFELWWHIAKIWSAWAGFYQENFLQKRV